MNKFVSLTWLNVICRFIRVKSEVNASAVVR